MLQVDTGRSNRWGGSPVPAYLSGDGKTRVNLFFKAPEHVQLTKVRIKVSQGLVSFLRHRKYLEYTVDFPCYILNLYPVSKHSDL